MTREEDPKCLPQEAQFQVKKRECYDALGKVRKKAVKVENIDESRYERGEGVTLATTGWVKVRRKNGKEFELKFDTIDQLNNGSYRELDEVSRREVGGKGKGRYLFGETQLWSITPNRIRTIEQLQECISTIMLLDRNIPAVVSTSS